MTIGSMLVYFGILLLLPLWASNRVKKTYQKYSKVRNSSGMTGRDVALKILQVMVYTMCALRKRRACYPTIMIHGKKLSDYRRITITDLHKQRSHCSSRGRTCYPACARLCILAF